MAKLSEDQIRFLTKHSIPLSHVFDASGMPRDRYQAAMRELGMLIAIGVSPCTKEGHTMKTRSGHCPQCGTHTLAFLRRHDEDGDVYVAVSKGNNLVKVGTAGDVKARMISLNQFEYGGANDWKLYYQITCTKAGKIEFHAQNLLQEYRSSKAYLKAGRPVDCQELFNCAASVAADAVRVAVNQLMPKSKQTSPTETRFSDTAKSLPPTDPNRKALIQIKGRVCIQELARLMDIKPHHVVQDLLKMKIHLLLDQEISRPVAEKICRKRGFTLAK